MWLVTPAKSDFWLALFSKAAELSLLLLLLQSLPTQPSPSCWCLSNATNITEPCVVQPQSSEVYVFCPFIFHRILSLLIYFSCVASLVQSLLCLRLPIHSLHFLSLSFFQLTIGISIPLLICYWQWESQEFPLYKSIPELNIVIWHLLLLQAIFFVFSFHRSYHHMWSNYKLFSD